MLFLAPLVCASEDEFELPELAAILKESVVVLEVDRGVYGSGNGTGFFISSNGTIATNAHVVESARRIVARTHDDTQIDILTVLAVDNKNDLALVQAAPGHYSPLRIGESSSVRTGEEIVILGNPLGLDFTLSSGIVSAVRGANALNGAGPEVPHLQITAPISFGSSGSPVLTLSGAVVGVVISGYVAAQNLNFAIPSERLMELQAASAASPAEKKLSSGISLLPLAISAVFFAVLGFIYFRFLREPKGVST